MSDDIKLDAKTLMDLKMLVESAEWGAIRRVDHARGLRGEVTANWLDNFMSQMYHQEVQKSSNLVDAKTGQIHTVESLVAELRERVGLDTLTKSGTGHNIPLSKKMAEQVVIPSDVTKAIENFLSSHRGHADDQAVLYYLRDTFGDEQINKISDKITTEIQRLKTQFTGPIVDHNAMEEAAMGQPLKLEENDPKNDQIFNTIQDGLNGKK
jgi:hypothetical protein